MGRRSWTWESYLYLESIVCKVHTLGQALLNLWDNNLKIDGEFGALTLTATKKWQQKVKGIGGDVEVNGIVDEDDWKEIIFVPTND